METLCDVTAHVTRTDPGIGGRITLTPPAPVQAHALTLTVVHRRHVTVHDDDVTD